MSQLAPWECVWRPGPPFVYCEVVWVKKMPPLPIPLTTLRGKRAGPAPHWRGGPTPHLGPGGVGTGELALTCAPCQLRHWVESLRGSLVAGQLSSPAQLPHRPRPRALSCPPPTFTPCMVCWSTGRVSRTPKLQDGHMGEVWRYIGKEWVL